MPIIVSRLTKMVTFVVKPWSIYVEIIRGVDGYAPCEIALRFDLSFSISASLALLREIQPIITQFDFDHVSPSLTKRRRKRSNLGIVASEQQAPKQGPQLALSAWRNGPIAPLHHRGDSVLGVDCGRSGMVKRGQAWSGVVDAGSLVGSGRAGGARARADRVQVWDSASYLSQIFRRAKKLGFAPLLKMPKDWRKGTLAAFFGCVVWDGMCGGRITRCRAFERFCAAGGCG